MAVFKHIVINTRFAFIFVFVLFLLFISPGFIFSFLLFLDLAANGFLRRFLFWGWWFCFFIFILMGWTIDTVSSLNYLEQIRGRKTLQLSGSSTLCSFIRLVSVRWSLLYVNPKKKKKIADWIRLIKSWPVGFVCSMDFDWVCAFVALCYQRFDWIYAVKSQVIN